MTGLYLTVNEHRGKQHGAASTFKWVVGTVARWRRQERTLRQLSRMSDHQLEDLGFTRRTLRQRVRGILGG
jgi:uncharacterized protein YjiS (DUF1127 family)